MDAQLWYSLLLSRTEFSTVPLRGLFERLEKRRKISLEEYEMLHEGEGIKSLIQPGGEFALAEIDHQGTGIMSM